MNQASLAFDPPCRLPAEGTQCRILLMAMQRGEILTVGEALTRYSVYALSQRCGELRRMNWPVVSRMVKLRSGKRIAAYRLDTLNSAP